MKMLFLSLLFIPVFSFAQLTLDQVKNIDDYTKNMCVCVNDLMKELHPKTIDVIFMIAELGNEEAMKEVEEMAKKMDDEEVAVFIASFETMEDEEFLDRMDVCSTTNDFPEGFRTEMNNTKGEFYEYLLYVLSREEKCKVMKALFELGAEVED